MNSLTDPQLLREYAERRSEAAFAELVRRHVDMVYSAALRMVYDGYLAEDVTQGVFVALARNAQQLTNHPVLAGWLHRTAQNLAANTVRSDVRRRDREQKAAAMNELISAEPDAVWEQIAPHLDAALGDLSELDRDALLLRYFQSKSAREMAQILDTTEEAAQKRVSRAVERLRESLSKRGVVAGTGGLAVVISANAVQAAPAGLAVAISTAAAVTGITTVATTITATITKAIAMTTLQKLLVTATIVTAVGAGMYEARQASIQQNQVRTLQEQQASLTVHIQQLQRELDRASNRLAVAADENAALKTDSAELVKLREELAQRKADSAASTNGGATQLTAQAWLDRVTRLKQRMEQTPNAKIPELKLVTEQDWLNAAKGELNTETDYRRALSAIRAASESKVAIMLHNALTGYMQGNNEQVPTDLGQLQPYFDTPVDEAILQRWEIAPAKTVPSLVMGGDVIITQKAPVDDVFDSRFGIGPQGYGNADFLYHEISEAMTPVWDAYRAAHSGQGPNDTSQLEPYVITPEQRAAFDKLMLRDANSK